jgi:hypothetical protein
MVMKKMSPVAAVLVLSALGGCSLFEETQKGPLISGASNTIVDVPVPSGFRYTDQGSWSKVDTEKKTRAAVQMFWGKAALTRVTEFYQKVLPENKWTAVKTAQQPKSFVITASKGNETLTIRTWDDTFYTYIEMTLEPGVGK